MVAPQHAERGKLGGLRRRQVIRELAFGDMSQADLARKYEVTEAAVSQFKRKHADEIAAVRANADDEFAGILIAQKVNRIEMYQDLLADALTPSPKIAPNGRIVTEQVLDPESGEWVEATVTEVDTRAAAMMLKSVAEEMGQLASRVQLSGDMTTTTTYKIAGVDPEDLT